MKVEPIAYPGILKRPAEVAGKEVIHVVFAQAGGIARALSRHELDGRAEVRAVVGVLVVDVQAPLGGKLSRRVAGLAQRGGKVLAPAHLHGHEYVGIGAVLLEGVALGVQGRIQQDDARIGVPSQRHAGRAPLPVCVPYGRLLLV
ncbi:hypothetical protein ACFLSJ_07365 [Verrucomicrobiota bacterium]